MRNIWGENELDIVISCCDIFITGYILAPFIPQISNQSSKHCAKQWDYTGEDNHGSSRQGTPNLTRRWDIKHHTNNP